jgi:hypothetical protein
VGLEPRLSAYKAEAVDRATPKDLFELSYSHRSTSYLNLAVGLPVLSLAPLRSGAWRRAELHGGSGLLESSLQKDDVNPEVVRSRNREQLVPRTL